VEEIRKVIKMDDWKLMQLDESGDAGGNSMMVEVEDDPNETLMYVAAQTKEMARVEKDVYAPIFRQWHPCPAAVAAVTLHTCFGTYFKRSVSKMSGRLSSESMRALQTASELDKYLVQIGDGPREKMTRCPLINHT
jgi:hypothetical protein